MRVSGTARRAARLAAILAATAALGVGLQGCGRGSGQQASSGAGASSASAGSDSGSDRAYAGERDGRGGGSGGYGDQADRAPVPLFHGEPMWSENRSHTAKENAEYHFERAGSDLGAKTLDDFLTKVHHFGDHPPAGTLSLTRANGDRLLYDPKANLFGVFTRQGAPRTVFKPSNGMDYWREQKTREAQGGGEGGYRGRSHGYGGGEGGAGSSDQGQ